MSETNAPIVKEAPIRIRSESKAWVTYISPFQFIIPDGESPLSLSLDEINYGTYNHGKLCRIVGSLDVLGLSELNMLVCYDGALAIPRTGIYKSRESALIFFNKIMCQLRLGGVLCEALDQRDIVRGGLHNGNMIWPVELGDSASSQLHGKLRSRVAGGFDNIHLWGPKNISWTNFCAALQLGGNYLNIFPNLTPSFLIRGITELRYNNWSLALSNLWISIEQIIDHLWNQAFTEDPTKHPINPIAGRISALKKDHRTWSNSIKQELLYQIKIIDSFVFERLYPARQARNKLVHDGKEIERSIAIGASEALERLLLISLNISELPLGKFYSDCRESFFSIPRGEIIEDFSEWTEASKNKQLDVRLTATHILPVSSQPKL